jgi:endonuclease YncB( thermonuclease family)
MIEPVQMLWSPAGTSMPSLGDRALVDVTDGDTPNIRMPIRMLSVDTPEVTARTAAGAAAVDEKLAQLAEWIGEGKAPISAGLAAHLRPKLATGKAGTLQFTQGTDASAFAKRNIETRLTRPGGSLRNLFIRVTETPFDANGRLLAYIAPNYSVKERETLSRAERATFNLDLLAAGWAAPFVIFPSIPGELDLPLLVDAAARARAAGAGIWSDPLTLPAYEYRAMEKLYSITKKIVAGEVVRGADRFAWRERYCADMRNRRLHGPEDYVDVPPEYRLWIWPADVAAAVDRLNLVPAPALVGAA